MGIQLNRRSIASQVRDVAVDAWPLQEVPENNFDADVDGMLAFFRATSEFYPDLDRLLRQRVMESHAAAEDEEEDEDEPEDGDESWSARP